MPIFELAAKHQMYLGAGNMIQKGEMLTLNIHSMGVQSYSLFSTPERRQQAIQQFAVNGIDMKQNSHLLNTGHWEIRKIQDKTFYRMENLQSYPFTENSEPEIVSSTTEFIDDVEMKKGCINLVKDFFNEEKDIDFSEKGLEGRGEICMKFYDKIKQEMGIDAQLNFEPMLSSQAGGYDPDTNNIKLNMRYLEKSDCEDLLNTILHESRHAFQKKCIEYPDLVSVKNNVIDVWKDNMENYIRPDFDFEAYENQEIEKDANYFADSVIKKGMNVYYTV